jgi:predicted nuclease of restriction endonuclease-like RecB superfamily
LLTADLVHVRRRQDQLSLVPLGPEETARALALAAAYLGLARAHVGANRGALLEAFRGVAVGAREQKLAKGLAKLVLDRCAFEEGAEVDPPALRSELFLRAAEARRQGTLDRAALVGAVAAERGLVPQALEAALYADLPDAHLLRAFEATSPEGLVAGYEAAQVQAVLLRAVKVTATVRAAPAAYRQLFRRLKFLRLLHRIERLPEGKRGVPGGYRIEIDGPFALFESVTKYGLQLALAFPAIAACDQWALAADVRWGREARPLRFLLRGEGAPAGAAAEEALPDDVAALLAQLREADSDWRPRVSDAVLELPGVGLCVPDLELTRAGSGETVYLEALGFWSREAVWKRIELVNAGLPFPIVFALSKHLRVSEEVLDDDGAGVLYVYSRTMNAKAVLLRVERAAAAAGRQSTVDSRQFGVDSRARKRRPVKPDPDL